jgi:hypothetical protein
VTISTLGKSTAHFPLPLELRYLCGRRWRLVAPFIFLAEHQMIQIPAGFETDFNSIPRWLWSLLPPNDHGEAAVVHDFLYAHPNGRSRDDCDNLYDYILRLLGAPTWKRKAMRWGLRLVGWRAWSRHRADVRRAARRGRLDRHRRPR